MRFRQNSQLHRDIIRSEVESGFEMGVGLEHVHWTGKAGKQAAMRFRSMEAKVGSSPHH